MILAALSRNELSLIREISFDPGGPKPLPSQNFVQVGVAKPPGGARGQMHPPDDWPSVVAALPELAAYHKAPRSPELERRHLIDLYASQRVQDSDEARRWLALAQRLLVDEAPEAGTPSWFSRGFPSPVELLSTILALNKDSHAGYPWVLTRDSKFAFAYENFAEVYHMVCLRLLALEHLAPHCDSPRALYENFCVDCVQTMIKNEVSKITKRPRIILIVSTIDEIVERLFSDHVSSANKTNWGSFFSCIGVGFSSDASTRLLSPFDGLPMASSDVPAFDVTRTEFEEHLDCDLLLSQYPDGAVTAKVFSIAHGRSKAASRSLVVFSDGIVWAQTHPGTQKTGRKLTSCYNTSSRARRSHAVGLLMCSRGHDVPRLVRCAGDDSVEVHHALKPAHYAELGFPLKDYAECVGAVDFCSQHWVSGSRPIGQRLAKSTANLLYRANVDSTRSEAYIREYSNHPDIAKYVRTILALRPGIKFCSRTSQLSPMSSKSNQRKVPPRPSQQAIEFAALRRELLRVVAQRQPRRPQVPPRPRRPNNAESVAGMRLPQGTSLGRTAAPLALGSSMSGNQGSPPVNFPLRRKEYVTDIAGSVGFVTRQYSLNPGLPSTFPWGSDIAPAFEEYDSVTVAFHYEPMDSANATGAVIVSFDYDAADAPPVDKNDALTYSDNVRVQPWVPATLVLKRNDLLKRGRLFTRSGNVTNTDIKTYDLGNVFVSTVGQADTDTIGEFWISYHFTLVTPQKKSPPGLYMSASTGVSDTVLFGTSRTTAGNLPASFSGNTVTFAQPGYFTLNVLAFGTGLTGVASAATASTGATVSTSAFSIVNSTATAITTSYNARVLAGSTITLDYSGATTITSSIVQIAPFFSSSAAPS